ncbi:MAG TPA: AraC family transcriptional regulator [Planctomycetota bacterium]|nr:AraC family transcriptional regulator [Planctomycetota bacterium]
MRLPRGHDGDLWHWLRRPEHFLHRHNELEACLVVRGHAVFIVENRKYVLKPQSMIWLFPAQEHLLVNQSRDFEMWLLLFGRRLLKKHCASPDSSTLRRADPKKHFCRTLPRAEAEKLCALYAQLFQLREQRDLFNAGLGYALLASWTAQTKEGATESGKDLHPSVAHAVRLIQNERTPLTLPDICLSAGMSSSRLCELFKEQMGVTLIQYRSRQRLQRFFDLYGSGHQRNMLSAALEAGFGSYPQFHRVFKALTGTSPAQYRREKKSGGITRSS